MPEPKQISYTIARFEEVAVTEFLSRGSCGQRFDTALIYTPDDCLVARVDGGAIHVVSPDGRSEVAADLSRAYEVRAFGQKAELRWVRSGTDGTATLLADGDVEAPETATKDSAKPLLEVLDRHYRVWSLAPSDRVAAPRPLAPSGWVAVGNGRVGTIRVPLAGAIADVHEVELRAREYAVRGEQGNAVVLFERLVGFAAVEDRKGRKGGNDV